MGTLSDRDIASEMIKRLSKKNYIPSGAYEQYENAFILEAAVQLGEQ